ncbi:MAG TPA: hypothetical protein VKR78_00375, partial [Acidimicrobiales bacterium]|nr:hypothetical protein [Acidimicrobiales bacterium]
QSRQVPCECQLRHSRERQRCGQAMEPGRFQMVLLYLSIPIMVIALAVAMLPLLATMRRDERRRREALALAVDGAAFEFDGELAAAA